MKLLDIVKLFYNLDLLIVAEKEAGTSNKEIMRKFEISKQRIYDARKRVSVIQKELRND